MTCDRTLGYAIPDATAQAAQRAFPKGNLYMTMRDVIGPIFTNPDFVDLYHTRGRPAEAPARLALILVMMEIEQLSDAQAAEAVRARIDWKYALALELDDPGFDASILPDFRTRLLVHSAEERLLTLLLDTLVDAGLLKARGRQRSDSTHVLANIRSLTRLTLVAETLRHALNDLATAAPDWLRTQIAPAWGDRYAVRVEEYRLPKDEKARQALVQTIGQDGFQLLTALHAPITPPDLGLRPAVQTLRAVWLQQYYGPHDVRWRVAADLPPHAQLITSPYDVEARFATKREISWTGYKVHLSETCDDDTPHLITNVETTPATTNDVCMTETIHTHLAERDLLPHEHLLDSGYVAAAVLVSSQQTHAVDVVGPSLSDNSWQAHQADGLAVACFAIDWEAQQVTCPAGHTSVRWTAGHDKQGDGQAVIAIQFAADDCRTCPLRGRCTQAKTGPRTMKLRPRDQHEALQVARQRQTTEAFKQLYAGRAGIEGTLSQGVRAFGLRHANYIGQAKTHLQHILMAIAINIVRVVAWIWEIPRTATRRSPFTRLAATMT
jgi:transposase